MLLYSSHVVVNSAEAACSSSCMKPVYVGSSSPDLFLHPPKYLATGVVTATLLYWLSSRGSTSAAGPINMCDALLTDALSDRHIVMGGIKNCTAL